MDCPTVSEANLNPKRGLGFRVQGLGSMSWLCRVWQMPTGIAKAQGPTERVLCLRWTPSLGFKIQVFRV